MEGTKGSGGASQCKSNAMLQHDLDAAAEGGDQTGPRSCRAERLLRMTAEPAGFLPDAAPVPSCRADVLCLTSKVSRLACAPSLQVAVH